MGMIDPLVNRLDGRNHRAGSTGGTRLGHGVRGSRNAPLPRWRRLGSKGSGTPLVDGGRHTSVCLAGRAEVSSMALKRTYPV